MAPTLIQLLTLSTLILSVSGLSRGKPQKSQDEDEKPQKSQNEDEEVLGMKARCMRPNQRKLKQVRRKLIQTKERCPIDLVFILDQSGSIQSCNFEIMKQFLVNLVSSLTIGPTAARVGLVKFNNGAKSEFFLKTYKSRSPLEAAITGLSYESGGTNIARGMSEASKNQFTSNHGDRPNVQNIAVVITDGQDSSDVEAERERLELKGVTVFAIGIGSNVDQDQLEKIAGDEARVFTVANFNNLLELLLPLCKRCCHSGKLCQNDCQCGPNREERCCDRRDPLCCASCCMSGRSCTTDRDCNTGPHYAWYMNRIPDRCCLKGKERCCCCKTTMGQLDKTCRKIVKGGGRMEKLEKLKSIHVPMPPLESGAEMEKKG